MARSLRRPRRYPALDNRIRERDLLYSDVGPLVGVTPQYISQVIRGHHNPSPLLKQRLATVLGATVQELFSDDQEVTAS